MKVIFWLTALVFIALVVFGWGAGLTARGSGKTKIDENIAGKVGKHDISYIDYQKAIQSEYEQAYNESRVVGESEAEMIRDRTWYSLVNRYLSQEEFKSKGVDWATDREVFESLRRDPPPAVTQNPNLQSGGQFDRALFEEFLRNPQVDWFSVEVMIRNNLPYNKLQEIVNALPVTTNLEAQIEFIFSNEKARASYIKFDPFALVEIAVDTSDAAIEVFYEENNENYRTELSVIVNHASIPIIPTPTDTQDVLGIAETLIVKLSEGEDFDYLAENYSKDPASRNRGGELGWFGKGQMISEFEEAAFAADSGEIVGPVLTVFGYHIIKVLDKMGEGDSTRVRAAHILLAIEPGIDTEESAKDLALALVNDVEDGDDFFEAAQKLGIDSVGQSAPLGEDDPIPGIGFYGRIRAMLFNSKVGSVDMAVTLIRERPILEAVTVVQSWKRIEAGIPQLIDVRDQIVTDMIMNGRQDAALDLCRKAKQLLSTGVDMSTAADNVGGIYDTTGAFARYDWVTGIGEDPIFKGTTFGLREPGRVSAPFLGEDGTAYIVRLEEIVPASPELYSQQAIQIKTEIANFHRQTAYERWFKNLRDNADIIDNRFQEYTQIEVEEEEGEGETE